MKAIELDILMQDKFFTKQDVEEQLLEAIDNLIAAEDVLTEIKGLEGTGLENLTDCFVWLSLKFRSEHPELFSEIISPDQCAPEDYLAEILAAAARKSIPGSCVLRGLSIRLTPNSYDFCISGSISEDDFQKLSGLHREWLCHEDESQSKRVNP